MELKLKKQPQKYLASVDAPTRKKLYRALDSLSRLEGDIVPLKGYQNRYRYKIHYRITLNGSKVKLSLPLLRSIPVPISSIKEGSL